MSTQKPGKSDTQTEKRAALFDARLALKLANGELERNLLWSDCTAVNKHLWTGVFNIAYTPADGGWREHKGFKGLLRTGFLNSQGEITSGGVYCGGQAPEQPKTKT